MQWTDVDIDGVALTRPFESARNINVEDEAVWIIGHINSLDIVIDTFGWGTDPVIGSLDQRHSGVRCLQPWQSSLTEVIKDLVFGRVGVQKPEPDQTSR